MSTRRFRSDVSEAIHSAALGLHRAKIINERTMCEYDRLCIAAQPDPRTGLATASNASASNQRDINTDGQP